MKCPASIVFACLVAWAWAAGAEVSCKLSCNDASQVCKTSLGEVAATLDRARTLTDCASSERRALVPMDVWYPRQAMLQRKSVASGDAIKSYVGDGDANCSGWRCLTQVKRSEMVGLNPMGTKSASMGSDSSGALVGLPYGKVLVPPTGLVVYAAGNAETAEGTFELSDGPSLPVRRGRIDIPASAVQPGRLYVYKLKTNIGFEASGDFWAAEPDWTERVDRAVARQLQGQTPTALSTRLGRIMVLTQANLRWDAAQLLRTDE